MEIASLWRRNLGGGGAEGFSFLKPQWPPILLLVMYGFLNSREKKKLLF